MTQYIVSARKYRPTTFDSVVGQQSLTTTLKNAIATGKLAHAYLFCGPRGVGKTTCARIFAKTINCLTPLENGEACNHCESCQAFNEGRSYNIHELDAASNNSVEDIRGLMEQVMMPPQVGRYKVFIIDEVHMLSTAAFNAFLKTLEEPPAHAIFILATTEKHKILPTILSRCQIYDFKRMEVADIVAHLERVAKAEGISYEPEALGVIARKADGGMRDAMSIFDQVTSYAEGNITYRKVIEDLNVLDYDYYFKATDLLLEHNIPALLVLLDDILSRGFQTGHFISGLAAHFRDLLVSRDAQTLPLLEASSAEGERYREQAARCRPSFIYKALRLCNQCDINHRTTSNKRLLVEITLIEIAQCEDETEACGHRPTQQLKPIFNRSQEATATAGPSVQTPVQQTQPSQAVTPTATSVASAPIPKPQPIQPARPARPSGISTISIRLGEAPQADNATVQASPTQTEAQPATPMAPAAIEAQPFTDEELTLEWRRFAAALPEEQRATSGRMQNITPRLADEWTVEVPVENEQVVNFMKPFEQAIVAHLRSNLHNGHIRLKFNVVAMAPGEKVYSRREQLEQIIARHPAIGQLVSTFQLEFD